jgi:hypothetical protein
MGSSLDRCETALTQVFLLNLVDFVYAYFALHYKLKEKFINYNLDEYHILLIDF